MEERTFQAISTYTDYERDYEERNRCAKPPGRGNSSYLVAVSGINKNGNPPRKGFFDTLEPHRLKIYGKKRKVSIGQTLYREEIGEGWTVK